MSQTEQWLTNLGLEKYISEFADAEVTFADLRHLTGEDLKEIGLPVGPRRRALEAIKQLNNDPAASARAPTVAAMDAPKPNDASLPPTDAERRQLTVMFVDLVGSTEMSTRLDAEDVRGVITTYQDTVAGVVSRHDGFIARYMGDGVLCYFGWPRANEDDAERAVRAGLDIISQVKNSLASADLTLATRVGIATGVVIVGDLIGTGAAQEAAVVGETPNLAARLQGLARPNQLIVSQETRSLLGNVFDLTLVANQILKGIAEPADTYRVNGEKTRESRFDARQTGTLTPIVGRERELQLILDCWTGAKSGTGQMVLVNGEAGIGKSRITRAVIDEIAQDSHIRITYQCSPYHTDSAFYPIIQQLTYAARIHPADASNERLDKLEGLEGINADNIVLIATLLGIDPSERYALVDLSPAQLRAQTIQTLIGLLVQQAHKQPVLVVFEDLHWVDPTTLELLDTALDAIGDHKILMLATARPTFEHDFGGHPIVSQFALNRLGKEQVRSIVDKLTAGKSVPDSVLQLIASRTDGVPLFVEELTKTILESGTLIDVGDRFALAGPLDALAIPSTLHDSLMARLDRLQPIKEVAQTAACIGREFHHRLLASISPLPELELSKALEGLLKAELIYRRGLPPDATYLFKHALVRDAAYGSLLKERRRSIHVSILAALEQTPEASPELLAEHAESASLTDRAINLWEAASKSAIARPAYDEGISHLKRAIALIAPQVERGERAVLERALGLQVQLSVASLVRLGYQADATRLCFEYALTLADKIGDTPLRYPVLYGLWVGRYVRGEHAPALQHAEALVRLAENSTESVSLVVAHRLVGLSLSFQGRPVEAQPHLERALALYNPVEHKGLEGRFGQDVGMAIHVWLGINQLLLGQSHHAEAHIREAEHAALASGHVSSICYFYGHLVLAAFMTQDEAEVERGTTALHSIADEHHLALWADWAASFKALLSAGKGDATGIQEYMRADTTLVAQQVLLYLPLIRIRAAWRALTLGLSQQAFELVSMTRTLIDETGESIVLPDLHRLEGALALNADDHGGAEMCLRKALTVARDHGSKLWEIRAANDLARLWASTGRNDEATALLRPIHKAIAEGDCTKDRATAQALLAELAT